MKRLEASLVILVLLVAGCVVSAMHTNRTYEKIYDAITQCETDMLAGDAAAAKRDADQTEKLWTASESGLAALINHDLINEIGLKITTLAPLASRDTSENFLAACKQAKISLLHMRNDHMLSPDTIF